MRLTTGLSKAATMQIARLRCTERNTQRLHMHNLDMSWMHIQLFSAHKCCATPLTELLLQAVDCCQVARIYLPFPAGTVAAQAAAAVAALACRFL